LAEAVLAVEGAHAVAAQVMVSAHDALLASGVDVSFWESGWLRHQLTAGMPTQPKDRDRPP
jgi:hypothetical protein